MADDDKRDCPACGSPCYRDSVDIGVGIQHGPWFCTECPWCEEDEVRSMINHDIESHK